VRDVCVSVALVRGKMLAYVTGGNTLITAIQGSFVANLLAQPLSERCVCERDCGHKCDSVREREREREEKERKKERKKERERESHTEK
jgi:hypothetical protein